MIGAAFRPASESWRPSSEQTLLLRAVLEPGESAVQAWRRWIEMVALDSLDPESMRLLPRLYLTLRRLQIDSPSMAILRGVHRHHWYRNRVLLARIEALVREAERSGLLPMLSHGAALALVEPGQQGARAMPDAGIAVVGSEVSAMVELLRSGGWLPARRLPYGLTESYVQAEHACLFRGEGGLELVLHWSLFDCRIEPVDESEVWRAAGVAEIDGLAVRVMNSTDLLLLVCAEAARWHAHPCAAWVADAATILQRAELDWPRFTRLARVFGLTSLVRRPLRFLREGFSQPVPADVLAELEATPASSSDRVFRCVETRPSAIGRAVYRMARHVRRYRQLRARRRESVRSFAAFLTEVHGLERASQLPGRFLRALRRAMGSR